MKKFEYASFDERYAHLSSANDARLEYNKTMESISAVVETDIKLEMVDVNGDDVHSSVVKLWISLLPFINKNDAWTQEEKHEAHGTCFEIRQNHTVVITCTREGENAAGPALWGISFVFWKFAAVANVVLLPCTSAAAVAVALMTHAKDSKSASAALKILLSGASPSRPLILIFEDVQASDLSAAWLKAFVPSQVENVVVIFCFCDSLSHLHHAGIGAKLRKRLCCEWAGCLGGDIKHAITWIPASLEHHVISPPLLMLYDDEDAKNGVLKAE